MRISRVAVRPRTTLAWAGSCTPGSCTTMRSMPCCWITGSATPSSLIRLCSVVMFCLSAASCRRRAASGLMVATRRQFAAVPDRRPVAEVGQLVLDQLRRAFSSAVGVAHGRSRRSGRCGSRWVPRMSFEREGCVRRSLGEGFGLLVDARRFMSTCSRKSTPPRRSRPRYIGKACSAVQPVRASATPGSGATSVGRVGGVGHQRMLDQRRAP